MTPHNGGLTPETMAFRWKEIAENLRRLSERPCYPYDARGTSPNHLRWPSPPPARIGSIRHDLLARSSARGNRSNKTAQDAVLASWVVYVSLGDRRVSGCQAAATDPMEGQAVGYSEARILSHRVCQSPYAQRDAEGMRHDAILPQLSLDLVLFGEYGASGCELVHAR